MITAPTAIDRDQQRQEGPRPQRLPPRWHGPARAKEEVSDADDPAHRAQCVRWKRLPSHRRLLVLSRVERWVTCVNAELDSLRAASLN